MSLRPHAGFLLLLALAAPAMVHFTASGVVASLGDDSVSYLMLARYILDAGDPMIRDWVGYQSHFPPLFPAALALAGGASSLAAAHGVVAAFAIVSVVLTYRYAALLLQGNAAGLLVTALFLLTPTAWISIHGILSESLFLCVTLGALYYHETRLASAEARLRAWLVFGLLLGAALLTRTAGVALIAAYGIHVVVGLVSRPRAPALARRLAPLLPVALMTVLWIAWRPTPEGFNYQRVAAQIVNDLLPSDPLRFLQSAAQVTYGGWLRSFTADSDVHWVPKAVFALVGIAGVAGAVQRARRNRLDGWYVLAMLPLVFVWLFNEDSIRRLLYPIVPLLLVHAALFVVFVSRRMPSVFHRRALFASAAALPLLLTVPAWILVQSRALDGERIYPGMPYRYSDMTEYFIHLDRKTARALAAKHAGVLGGLEALRTATPERSRVVWLRPDYVTILGERRGLPLFEGSTRHAFLAALGRAGADYVVVSSLYKAGMDGDESSPEARFNWALQVSTVAHAVPSLAGGGRYDLAILKIDPAALEKALRGEH